jgi:hypothetical protein
LQLAPSAVVGWKLPPAAQPARANPKEKSRLINFTKFPFKVENGAIVTLLSVITLHYILIVIFIYIK